MSKFDLAVIVAAVAGGALWIEHRHRVVIDAPASAELAAHAPAAACPDNDNVPYSAGCIVFLGSSYLSGMNWQANAAESAPPYKARSHLAITKTGARQPSGLALPAGLSQIVLDCTKSPDMKSRLRYRSAQAKADQSTGPRT